MVTETCEPPELIRAKTDSGRLGDEEVGSARPSDSTVTGLTNWGALLVELATRDATPVVGSESESEIPVRSTCTTSFLGDDADKSARLPRSVELTGASAADSGVGSGASWIAAGGGGDPPCMLLRAAAFGRCARCPDVLRASGV